MLSIELSSEISVKFGHVLLYLTISSILISACGLATKRDIADLKKDVQGVREEVRSEARKQEQQAQRQADLAIAIKNKVTEPSGLAAMIARDPVRTWYGIEFLLAAGFSFTAALRLRHKSRVTDMWEDDYKIVAFARKLLNTVGARRKPDPPEPPDDKPPLRVVK